MYFIAICDDEDNYIKYIKNWFLKSLAVVSLSKPLFSNIF